MNYKAGRGGWSKWVFPAKNFRWKCCGCGLVHEIEFGTNFRTRREQKNLTKSIKRTKKRAT